MTAPTLFKYQGREMRVITGAHGEPWWVATDVAKILGYRDAPTMTRWLEEDEVSSEKISDPCYTDVCTSQVRRVNIINESGLYTAIIRSRRPEAKAFRRWVTGTVLPSIRKHGAYMTPQTIEDLVSNPDMVIELATKLKEEQQRVRELEPAARSWEYLAAPGGDYSVGAAAKILSRDPAITIGRNNLFAFMAGLGWIFKTKGRRPHWEPYQSKGLETGRLTVKTNAPFFNEKTNMWEQPGGTVRVTVKGLHELHKRLNGTHDLVLDDADLVEE